VVLTPAYETRRERDWFGDDGEDILAGLTSEELRKLGSRDSGWQPVLD